MRKKSLNSITFWIITIELLFLIILYIMGFRITYGSDENFDWTAIGACGQWAGAIVGLLIPVAAVYFQYILNKKQMEISLSNVLLLEELKEFKKKHEADIIWLSRNFYEPSHIYSEKDFSEIETILTDHSSDHPTDKAEKNTEFLHTNELK